MDASREELKEMKKVGIATYHFADNYGAVLQCYALQKVINGFDGICAEVIDYRPPEFRYKKVWTTEKERKLFYKKMKLLESFLNTYCQVAPYKVPLINGEGYDYCCAGSDQIWNMDPMYREYFFPNVDENIYKFSYAASMGLSVAEIRQKERELINYLPAFQKISVREKEHAEYLTEVSGKECCCVIDPTLLLNDDDYISIIHSKDKQMDRPFLFFYWLMHDHELFRGVELANMLARLFDLRIIHSIYGADPRMFFQGGRCMYYEGIDDFLWYIKNAAFVVTNSYHGVLFSIQFEVPFYSFIVESMRSRFNTLTDYMDISNRIVTEMKDLKEINDQIDFKKIKGEIGKFRAESIAYLKSVFDITI